MKTLERVAIVGSILAIAMSLINIAGGGLLSALSLLVLSQLYFALSFALLNGIKLRSIFKKSAYKDTNTLRIIGAIGAGWALSNAILGILFKIQSYPGAGMMLLIGMISLGAVFVLSVIKFFMTQNTFYKAVLWRVVPVFLFTVVMYVVSSDTLLDIKYRDFPVYRELLKEHHKDPNNDEVFRKLQEERQKMIERK